MRGLDFSKKKKINKMPSTLGDTLIMFTKKKNTTTDARKRVRSGAGHQRRKRNGFVQDV